MYGNLIKTIFVTFLWLSLLLAAPQALAVPKSIVDAQNSANQVGTAKINEWNAAIKKQNEMVTAYLKSEEGAGDAQAQAQYQQLSAGGATTTGTTLSTNANTAASTWNANTGSTNTGSTAGTSTGSTISASSYSNGSTGSLSQRELLNRAVPKIKEEAGKVAMECASEFTQSVDAATKNRVIGSAPSFASQYVATGDVLTAAQFCNWILSNHGLTRQAQVVMAAAAGQPLVPQGQEQSGMPSQLSGYGAGFTNGVNQNVGMVLAPVAPTQYQDPTALALAAQAEARADEELKTLLILLVQGFGTSSSSGNGDVDPLLLNLLFSGAM